MADSRQSSPRGSSNLRAVNKALRSAKWLTDADAGAVALVRTLSRQLDALQRDKVSPPLEVATKMNSTSTQLLQVMDSLGLTARGRRQLDISEPDTSRDELSDVRAEHRRAVGKSAG